MKKTMSYISIVVVAFLAALNYELFVLPNRFAPAGLNGICTMLQYLLGISIGYLNILINIPLAIAVYFCVNKYMAMRSMVYSLCFSGFILVLEQADLSALMYSTPNSAILGPLVAGLISGAGAGLIFKSRACQGGTDFIAAIIHRYKPQVNFFWAIFALNTAVAAMSYFVYDYQIEPVLLCILYSYTSSAVQDSIMQKSRSAVRCEIVTESPEELGRVMIETLHHTVTQVPAKGMYSGRPKSVLVCIVNRSQVDALCKLVSRFPNSFMIVSHVSDVIGNFRRLDSRGNPQTEFFDLG